jgi:enoyl-CoA hydratase/carnithine racemase
VAFDTILFDKREGIATVTLNRPERLNAMTWPMIEELLDAIEDCRHDDAVRVLVFTGAGRAFSSGDDIVVLSELDSYTDYEWQLANRVRETADHAEGRASFRDKRPPKYVGR